MAASATRNGARVLIKSPASTASPGTPLRPLSLVLYLIAAHKNLQCPSLAVAIYSLALPRVSFSAVSVERDQTCDQTTDLAVCLCVTQSAASAVSMVFHSRIDWS